MPLCIQLRTVVPEYVLVVLADNSFRSIVLSLWIDPCLSPCLCDESIEFVDHALFGHGRLATAIGLWRRSLWALVQDGKVVSRQEVFCRVRWSVFDQIDQAGRE